MPTLSMMRIPPPRSWEEFQNIATSALKARWSSPTLTQYGRQGQAQQGVDIFGPDHLGRATGVQCKCQESLDDKTVAAEIVLAEKFVPALNNFYFALAGPRDARIQQHLRLMSETRLLANKFAVGIFFWDDLLEDLTANPVEFKRHFPEIHLDGEPAVDVHAQIFSAYDIAYHGSGVRHTVDLIFGEIGFMLDENPIQIDQLMRTIEASSQCLLAAGPHGDLVGLARKLVDAALAARKRKGDWATVDGLGGSIEAIVRGLEYTLKGLPLLALDLGFAMRRWEHISGIPETPVSAELRDRLLDRAKRIGLPNAAVEQLREAIEKFNSDLDLASGSIPWGAYNAIRRAIRGLRLNPA
jgi:hypothetical protein